MSVTEQDMIKMNKGKTASYVLDLLDPTLLKMQNGVLSRMKMMYLSGEFTESKLLACAAELCTIDNIKNSLRSDICSSEAVSKNMEIKYGRDADDRNNA